MTAFLLAVFICSHPPTHVQQGGATPPLDPPDRAAIALQNAGVAAARAGQFEIAIERLEEARRLAPGNPTIRANLADVLVGWAHLRWTEGASDEAARLAERATRLIDGEERPRAAFVAHRLLGWALYDLDEYASAAHHLRRAAALRADPAVEALAARAETDAEIFRGSVPLPTERLRVAAPPELLGAARSALPDLEEAYDAAERVVGAGGLDRRRPVSVLVYPADRFDRSGSPEWAAGFFDGKVRLRLDEAGPDGRLPAHVLRVARHEFAHALLEAIAPRRVPIWLHEGIAILAADAGGAGALSGGTGPSAAARAAGRRAIDDDRWVPLPALEDAFRLLIGADTADPFARPPEPALLYAEAEIFARHIVETYGAGRLADLVAAIAGGAEPLAALEEVTLRSPLMLDEEVRRSL